jgi:hypothetical protein
VAMLLLLAAVAARCPVRSGRAEARSHHLTPAAALRLG